MAAYVDIAPLIAGLKFLVQIVAITWTTEPDFSRRIRASLPTTAR